MAEEEPHYEGKNIAKSYWQLIEPIQQVIERISVPTKPTPQDIQTEEETRVTGDQVRLHGLGQIQTPECEANQGKDLQSWALADYIRANGMAKTFLPEV